MRLHPLLRLSVVAGLLAATLGQPPAAAQTHTPAPAHTHARAAAPKVLGQAVEFGAPFLVRDLSASVNPEGSDPYHYVTLGGAVYFTAYTPAEGLELYRTTGTLTGTTRVADIYPGVNYGVSVPFYGPTLAPFSGRVYFNGRTAEQGEELWASDGTLTGTVQVRDIATGTQASEPEHFVTYSGALYFTANDHVHGEELWKTDGTGPGTVRVTDLDPGFSGADIDDMVAFDSRLWFDASYNHGDELWVSDGTNTITGTYEFKNINTDTSFAASSPHAFTPVGPLLYFVADNGLANGEELWVTDGVDNTITHTFMVSDVRTGSGDSDPEDLVGAAGYLFFSAFSSTVGRELFRTDGTMTGTVLVADIYTGTDSSNAAEMTPFNGAVYYVANDGVHGYALWRSTLTTTEMVTDVNPIGDSLIGNLLAHNGFLYFSASDGVTGREVWRTDGTTTTRLTDLNPGAADAGPYGFFGANANNVFFGADNGVNGSELYRLTVTPTVISLVKNIAPDAPGTNIDQLSGAGSQHAFFSVYTSALGDEPYASDGTITGTLLLGDFVSGSNGSDPSYFAGLGDGRTLFTLGTTATGDEPWLSDGTPGGTLPLRDVYTGTSGSYPDPFVVLGPLSVFFADDGVHGEEVWRTDGTPGGTLLARDIYTGAVYSFSNTGVAGLGDLAIFGADDGVHGAEVWASDGTYTGTRELSDLVSPPYFDSYPEQFVTAGSRVFYTAYDLEGNDAMYFTDGQSVTLALDPDDTGLSRFDRLRAGDSGVFFEDALGSQAINVWWTDGYTFTQLTTFTTTDERIDLQDAVTVGDRIFFRYCDLVNGCELWQASPAGAGLVRDIYPGLTSSDPTDFVAVGDVLVFAAADPAGGRELWISDGTLAGTTRLADIQPGAANSNPTQMVVSGGLLYFEAYTDAAGYELWAMAITLRLFLPLALR